MPAQYLKDSRSAGGRRLRRMCDVPPALA